MNQITPHLLDLNIIGSSNPDILSEITKAKYDLREDTCPDHISINGQAVSVEITIEVSKEKRVEFLFSRANGEVVARQFIGNKEFYQLVDSYKDSIRAYADGIRTKTYEECEILNDQRRNCHNAGAQMLQRLLRRKIVLSHVASRILFNLATNALN